MNKRNIAIFSGSFDPPHIGHIMVVCYVLSTLDIDKVWIIPCFMHPFSKPLTSYQHRKEMIRLSMEIFGNLTEISDIEKDLGGVSYTAKTIEYLKEKYPDYNFLYIVGGDILKEKHLWKDFEKIENLTQLVVIAREGFLEGEPSSPLMPKISSSALREMIGKGENVDKLVSKKVLKYIQDNGLYR